MFGITAIKVVTMMAYGIPGYLLIKTKTLSESAIPAFAKFLLYICQPALMVYSFDSVDFSPLLLKNLFVFFLVTLAGQAVIIGLYALIFKKKLSVSAHRIAAVAGACGNVGFLGLPLLRHLLPQFAEAAAYSAAFSVSMNLLAWTVGLTMITGNRRYVSAKAVFVNPAMISFLISLPLFVFGIKLPEMVSEPITLLGQMSTPVCMTVLGMRLATKSFFGVFANRRIYSAAVSKLVIFPLTVAALMWLVPVDPCIKAAAFVLCCCPAAAMIQSLAESHGGDSGCAADIVLSTNLLCIITIPLMWTLYNTFVL